MKRSFSLFLFLVVVMVVLSCFLNVKLVRADERTEMLVPVSFSGVISELSYNGSSPYINVNSTVADCQQHNVYTAVYGVEKFSSSWAFNDTTIADIASVMLYVQGGHGNIVGYPNVRINLYIWDGAVWQAYFGMTYSDPLHTYDMAVGYIIGSYSQVNGVLVKVGMYVSSGSGVGLCTYVAFKVTGVGDWTFAYSLSPQPTSIVSDSWVLTQGLSYMFYGTLRYNASTVGVDGTWILYTSGLYGDLPSTVTYSSYQSGSFVDGNVSFALTSRLGYGDLYEYLMLRVTCNGTQVYGQVYQVLWVYVVIPSSEEGQGVGMSSIVSFIVLFIVLGLPAMILGMAGAKSGWGLQGMLFGAFLGLGIGVIASLVPFWFVFALVLFMVLFLYSMVSRS